MTDDTSTLPTPLPHEGSWLSELDMQRTALKTFTIGAAIINSTFMQKHIICHKTVFVIWSSVYLHNVHVHMECMAMPCLNAFPYVTGSISDWGQNLIKWVYSQQKIA